MNPSGSSQHVKAEILAAEALAADYEELVAYDPENSELPLDEWLDVKAPSVLSRDDGVGWIYVRSPFDKKNDDHEMDLVAMQREWEMMQKAKVPITFQRIQQLALDHSVKFGKWLFHVQTGYKVDILWKIVAKNMVEGNFPEFVGSAKVSPQASKKRNASGDERHVVCVYNNNFTDQDEVFQLEEFLRKFGIKCQLLYKPDVYTYLGIYRNNQWGLMPTIYRSNYEILSRKSKIEATFRGGSGRWM